MNNPRYDLLSRVLHWVMASVIIYAAIAGYVMHFVTGNPELFSFLSVLNMSLATVATPLLAIRYVWSHFRTSPPMPSSVAAGQICIAKLAHSLMYLVMFMVFSTGYLMLRRAVFLILVDDRRQSNNGPRNQQLLSIYIVLVVLPCLFDPLAYGTALKHHASSLKITC